MLVWLMLMLAALLGLFYLLSGRDNPLASLAGGELAVLAVSGGLALLYVVSLAGDDRGRALQALRHLGSGSGCRLRPHRRLLVPRRAVSGRPPRGRGAAPGREHRSGRRRRGRRAGRAPAQAARRTFSVRGAPSTATRDDAGRHGRVTVVLKPADAERAGDRFRRALILLPVNTANGMTYAAPVRLRTLADRPHRRCDDVDALVANREILRRTCSV